MSPLASSHVTSVKQWGTSSVCWRTFCLSGHCLSQSEGSLLRTSRCQPGFLHLTGGPRPPRLHPHLGGRALSHCAALHQSDRCPPGLSAYWRPTGSLIVQTGCHCRCADCVDCVDCVAHPHCRLQTAPIRQKEKWVSLAVVQIAIITAHCPPLHNVTQSDNLFTLADPWGKMVGLIRCWEKHYNWYLRGCKTLTS